MGLTSSTVLKTGWTTTIIYQITENSISLSLKRKATVLFCYSGGDQTIFYPVPCNLSHSLLLKKDPSRDELQKLNEAAYMKKKKITFR